MRYLQCVSIPDINIGVIQVKLKYKPPPESPIANISDKHELDLAGNHSENRSVWIIDRLELGKQPDSRGRPERQAWMREVEQIFGSSVVYFLIGFAVALIVFFVMFVAFLICNIVTNDATLLKTLLYYECSAETEAQREKNDGRGEKSET
jgi:hypothetical protein